MKRLNVTKNNFIVIFDKDKEIMAFIKIQDSISRYIVFNGGYSSFSDINDVFQIYPKEDYEYKVYKK